MAFFFGWLRRGGTPSEQDPQQVATNHIRRGNKLLADGKLAAALLEYEAACNLDDANGAAHTNLGFVLREHGRLDEARRHLQYAVKINPHSEDAHYLIGLIAASQSDPGTAIHHLELAVRAKPGFDVAWADLCRICLEAGKTHDARRAAEQGLAANPKSPDLLFGLANIYLIEKMYPEAITRYEQLLAIVPDHFEACNNLGSAFRAQHRLDEAQASYERAIRINPDYADAYSNRGVVLQEMKRLHDALVNFDLALSIAPGMAEAYFNRGIVLHELRRYGDALASYDQAIRHKPDYGKAYGNRGNVHVDLKDFGSAIADFEQAMTLKEDTDYFDGNLLLVKMQVCDWQSSQSAIGQLLERITRSERASTPFPVLALSDDLAVQQKAAEVYMTDKWPPRYELCETPAWQRHEKIRIGYYSADFHNHATTYLMAELFELHDRSRFELIGFSFGPDRQDEMRQRVSRAFDRFIDVCHQSDREIAELSRNLQIDIAVDLKGYTQDSRPGIFAYRAAPVQVSYLGYPGTLAAPYMDYLVADNQLVPTASRSFYTEKIAYLPDSYQINDTRRQIAERAFTRAELGLPPVGFIFCCFNNNYKICPETFDSWMCILRQVEGSVLWLFEDNLQASTNLRREAEHRGISSERLVFAKPLSLPEHLARQQIADLFLDTLPYNAHTTASDALWAGLPVLTLPGRSFAARVSASLLHAVGLPELVVQTREEYERLAVDLALNPGRLDLIKHKLKDGKLNFPLFDARQFTRHLEAAYTQMHALCRSGQSPQDIRVFNKSDEN